MTPVVGVVEGFYGRPWSWRERERMAEFMAERGFNFLAYAPKNDPLHRDRWREPYLPEEIDRFERFVHRCDRIGIEFSVGVSPLAFRYHEAGDFDLLWDKLAVFAAAGVRSFGLLMDDMPASAPECQVELVNAVWARLREVGANRLVFTPTEYCGTGTSVYLAALGRGLDPQVDIFWTGPAVCSRELTDEHVRTLAATLRRPPLIWDNYPVNDLEMCNDPHLLPLTGRSPGLVAATRGVVWAAGPGAEMPKVALGTCGAFAIDPSGYDAGAAWLRSLSAVAGNAGDAAALALLAELSWRSALEARPAPPNPFSEAVDDFWRRWETGEEAQALRSMRYVVAGLREAGGRLQRAANPALRREVRPWADKLVGWAEVAELALLLLERRDAGLGRSILERLARCRSNFAFVLGDEVDIFARRCLRLLRPVLLERS